MMNEIVTANNPFLKPENEAFEQLIILKSKDNETWEPVAVGDLPDWVREPSITEEMTSKGIAIREENDDYWYCCLSPEDYEKKLSETH